MHHPAINERDHAPTDQKPATEPLSADSRGIHANVSWQRMSKLITACLVIITGLGVHVGEHACATAPEKPATSDIANIQTAVDEMSKHQAVADERLRAIGDKVDRALNVLDDLRSRHSSSISTIYPEGPRP